MSALTIFYAGACSMSARWCSWSSRRQDPQLCAHAAPLKIPTTPAPDESGGVGLRMAARGRVFESLSAQQVGPGIFGWTFHAALLLVLLPPSALLSSNRWWAPIALIQPFGTTPASRWCRPGRALGAPRWFVDRVRYISTRPTTDARAAAGPSACRAWACASSHTPTSCAEGLRARVMRFDCKPLPTDPVLLMHLTLSRG